MSRDPNLLWLTCHEKACCHGAPVIVTGRDLWRISTAFEVAPWDVTRCAPAGGGAVGAFRLEPGGLAHQVVLARRGRAVRPGAPCIFLWKLGDGHAQCGLGATRPLVCRARPTVGCTCSRSSLLDLDPESDGVLLAAFQRELAEHCEVVAAWNRDLAETGPRTYRDFCSHLVAACAEAG